jgi:putative endonuclease
MQYYVYIITNSTRRLYTGLTNDLYRRVYEHKNKLSPGFTTKYNLTWLVYYEVTGEVTAAISREKQIKGWLRSKKIALVESHNPQWKDLSMEWYGHFLDSSLRPSTSSGLVQNAKGGKQP